MPGIVIIRLHHARRLALGLGSSTVMGGRSAETSRPATAAARLLFDAAGGSFNAAPVLMSKLRPMLAFMGWSHIGALCRARGSSCWIDGRFIALRYFAGGSLSIGSSSKNFQVLAPSSFRTLTEATNWGSKLPKWTPCRAPGFGSSGSQ